MENLIKKISPSIALSGIIYGYYLHILGNLYKIIVPSQKKRFEDIKSLGEDHDMKKFIYYMVKYKPMFLHEDGFPFFIETRFIERFSTFRNVLVHSDPAIIPIDFFKDFHFCLLDLRMISGFDQLLSLVEEYLKLFSIEIPSISTKKVRFSISTIKKINRDILPIIVNVRIKKNKEESLTARFIRYNGNNTMFWLEEEKKSRYIPNRICIEGEIPTYLLPSDINMVEEEIYFSTH